MKGQQSRTGKGRRFGFEGGQTPLFRRQPKLGGFRNPRRVPYEVLTLSTLERLEAGAYDIAALKQARIVQSNRPVKLLARGAVSKKFTLTVNAASPGARAAVEKAGGSVTIKK
jgi:large subunit ribosomal protein L15